MKIIIPLLIMLTSCSVTTITSEPETTSATSEPISNKHLSGIAQVSGVVKEENGEPIPFAEVSIIQNDTIITGVVTNLEGEFKIDNLEKDSYTIEINYVGYSSYSNFFQIKETEKIDLGTIILYQGAVLLKPIIYLYPEKETKINVSMQYDGHLTHTYPEYPLSGWNVTALPDGTLWDENGQEYYALFWEGRPSHPIQPKDGFVVAGSETIPFLEEKLAQLGLNRREANEFIMFWMPQMEKNPYNFIHFAAEEYEAISQLKITPQPETIIRVMMLTQAMDDKINFPQQDISTLKIERKGFTVVEWGGSLITTPIKG